MAKTKTRPYDVAAHLRTPEEMALYFDACVEECAGDDGFIAKAVDDITRALREQSHGKAARRSSVR